MSDRTVAYTKRARSITLAQTYMRKAEALLAVDLPMDPGYWSLLDTAIGLAHEIVRQLPDDFFGMTL